jgi:hypothetical protein
LQEHGDDDDPIDQSVERWRQVEKVSCRVNRAYQNYRQPGAALDHADIHRLGPVVAKINVDTMQPPPNRSANEIKPDQHGQANGGSNNPHTEFVTVVTRCEIQIHFALVPS